jgi:hypothetical protein
MPLNSDDSDPRKNVLSVDPYPGKYFKTIPLYTKQQNLIEN